MRQTTALLFAASRCARLHTSRRLYSEPVVRITNGTFYRQHPESRSAPGQDTTPNLPLFPGLSLELPSFSTPNQHWAILSPSSSIRTAFLQLLRGQLLCFPPTARTYPWLLSPDIAEKKPRLRHPEQAIEYVGFDVERKAFGGAYLSARYESLREEGDFTLKRYLTGIVTLNPGEEELKAKTVDEEVTRQVMKDLELERFLEKPVNMLSNGQSRRARIGKALLTRPEVLCLDAPFIGLDPIVTQHISRVLHRLAEANAPRIVLSLRPQDAIPEWITHIVYAGEDGQVDSLGPKEEVFKYLKQQYDDAEQSVMSSSSSQGLDPKLVELREVGRHLSERGDFETDNLDTSDSPDAVSRDGYKRVDSEQIPIGEPVVEMQGVHIKYGANSVLGNWTQIVNGTEQHGLHWTVHRGQRWGIFGANGSGKTTLLSLVTSDHPQTYSAPVKLFQRSRLPEPGVPGISIFEIQSRMGHASPEVHALFPKHLSVRRSLESAWSATPIVKPVLDESATRRVEASLRWFEEELSPVCKIRGVDNKTRGGGGGGGGGGGVATFNTRTPPSTSSSRDLDWASTILFGELSHSAQRVLLFLRATIASPDIVILDEAFSGMDDVARDKCLLFLARGTGMALQYTAGGAKSVVVGSRSERTRNGSSARETCKDEDGKEVEKEVEVPGLQPHQALLCISHSRHEVPGCVREWICLPEGGTGMGVAPRVGRLDGPVEMAGGRWGEIWGRGG